MIWIEMSVLVAAGILSMLAVRVVRRPPNVVELGSVSHQWIVSHRGDGR